MNRRDFLKMVGAVSVAGVVGVGVDEYSHHEHFRSVGSSGIYSIDPSEVPLLQMMGRGEKVAIGDWPSARYTWVEDTGGFNRLQPGHPNYFDYTNYVDTDPFKDEEPYLDW